MPHRPLPTIYTLAIPERDALRELPGLNPTFPDEYNDAVRDGHPEIADRDGNYYLTEAVIAETCIEAAVSCFGTELPTTELLRVIGNNRVAVLTPSGDRYVAAPFGVTARDHEPDLSVAVTTTTPEDGTVTVYASDPQVIEGQEIRVDERLPIYHDVLSIARITRGRERTRGLLTDLATLCLTEEVDRDTLAAVFAGQLEAVDAAFLQANPGPTPAT